MSIDKKKETNRITIGTEGVTSDTMSDIKVKNKNRLKFIGEYATRNYVYTKDSKQKKSN